MITYHIILFSVILIGSILFLNSIKDPYSFDEKKQYFKHLFEEILNCIKIAVFFFVIIEALIWLSYFIQWYFNI